MLTDDQIQDIINTDEDINKQYFVWCIGREDKDLQLFLPEIINELEHDVVALMIHTRDYYSNCADDITASRYLVLTDEEATDRASQYAADKLSDTLYDVPEHLHQYFDSEEYISDLTDDRGSLLNYWDGSENEETVEGITYYIYRQ